MATHDYVIANGTGAAVRSDLNNALAAIVSNNSSSTEPGTTYAYQWWADTNANVLKIRNSANDGWITLRELDGTMLIEDGSASTPGLAFADDVNTGIFSPAADQIGFATGGAERLEIGSSEVVFNDPSNDVDFRVESNGQTHMLFVDGGNDSIGVGISNPGDYHANANAIVSSGGITLANTTMGSIYFADSATGTGEYVGQLNYEHSNNSMQFGVNNGERMRIDSSGRLLVGTSSGSGEPIAAFEGRSNDASDSGIVAITRTGTNPSGSIGELRFATGSDFDKYYGMILCQSDGSTSSTSLPGALRFSTTASSATSPTERLRITSGGKIQVTGTRGGTLQASDNDSLELYTSATTGNANTGTGITFYNNHGNGHVMGGTIQVIKNNGTYENSRSDMVFGTRKHGADVAYRAKLTSHGSWETFSDTINIDIANSQSSGNNEAYIYARYGSTSLSAGTLSFRVYTNGNVQNTNNSYGSVSDQNLKENIVDATSQWDDIKALQVRKYNFREATGHQTHTQLGLIAQEVETVSPGLVEVTAVREGETCEDADGNQLESIKSINYSVLYMKAVKALQEAMDRIETLETKVAALEAG